MNEIPTVQEKNLESEFIQFPQNKLKTEIFLDINDVLDLLLPYVVISSPKIRKSATTSHIYPLAIIAGACGIFFYLFCLAWVR